MISPILFMCLTNTVSISSSNMNNTTSSSNSNNNNNNKDEKKENIDDILDVIFDYTGNGDDELTLRRGSKLEVLSKDESISGSRGWWTGRLVDSESVGIFPANFVANSQPDLRIIDYNDLQIGDTIGVGGFGHVFHGKFGDVDVAIKTAKSLASFSSVQTPTATTNDQTSDTVLKTLIDSLLREARLFSNLKHRNIIQLFGVSPCLSTKNLYLVMEYAQGGALNQLLQRRQSGLYPNVFSQYAKQIADGMRYLHDEAPEHIIHRDLKCSNILILEAIGDVHDDQDLLQKTLKITDFGLAKKQLQSSSMSAAGTFAWMSPECIRNSEFSTKSDVWSFGVLLWECLTGELPYSGFDQMQVAFGVATNKYSLPLPSTCPEEFSQLITNCWKILPHERPTFRELLEQINRIIESNSNSNEEFYQSLQKDWRQEIQEMFNELKEKEQEIRDREQAMYQRSLEQNHQRLELEKWEQQLHEREMHIVELELRLLMAKNDQERPHHQTPKIQKRSGRFMRSLLNGTTNLTSSPSTLISSPTNFRHLISVCHNPPGHDHNTSPTIPTSSSSPISCPNLPNKSHYNRSYSSSSTPTTPNMSRLRTLTSSGDLIINNRRDEESLPIHDVHFPDDGSGGSMTTPEKPPRSMSQTKSCGRKSKTATIKRRMGKTNGESKWYLETSPTNQENTTATSSIISTPVIDRPSRKLVSESSDELSSSSSSLCSTPNDRSFLRALFDINSILTSFGLGRHIDSPITMTTTSFPQPLTIIQSRKYSKRTSSSSILDDSGQSTDSLNTTARSRPCSSPVRPNSLILSSSQKSEQITDDDNDKYYSAQSSKISTPMVHSINYPKNSDEKLYLTSIIDSEEQRSHSTKVLSPKMKARNSSDVFEKDLLQ